MKNCFGGSHVEFAIGTKFTNLVEVYLIMIPVFSRGPLNKDTCQVWVHSTLWFQRKRLKFTDEEQWRQNLTWFFGLFERHVTNTNVNVFFFFISVKYIELYLSKFRLNMQNITSKSTKTCFFVILTDIWLIVPSDCGPQMGGGSHRTLPETN